MLNSALQHKLIMRLTIIITFIFFITGCAPKQLPVNYSDLNVADILQRVKTNQESIMSLRGVARIKAKSNYDDLVIRQVTLLQLPLKFRLEALAAFGQSIAVLTSDGEEVIFRTSNDQVVFQDVRNFNLSNFYPGIPSELKTEQLIDLLLGKIPFGLWQEDYDISFDSETQKLVLNYINLNNHKTVLTLNPLSGDIENAAINLDESNILYIDYTNFTKLDNLVFPKAIDLKYQSYELSIKYGELNLNDQIDDSLFFQ